MRVHRPTVLLVHAVRWGSLSQLHLLTTRFINLRRCWPMHHAGGICDIIQAMIDYGISLLYQSKWEKETVCWTLGYILSIWVRHFSHRILVFGDYEGSYINSLMKTYLTYSSSIVISMIANHYLVSLLRLTHREAWIITMLWTGIYNYFLLKSSWRNPADKATSGPGAHPSSHIEWTEAAAAVSITAVKGNV
jgi:hypothetical protein